MAKNVFLFSCLYLGTSSRPQGKRRRSTLSTAATFTRKDKIQRSGGDSETTASPTTNTAAATVNPRRTRSTSTKLKSKSKSRTQTQTPAKYNPRSSLTSERVDNFRGGKGDLDELDEYEEPPGAGPSTSKLPLSKLLLQSKSLSQSKTLARKRKRGQSLEPEVELVLDSEDEDESVSMAPPRLKKRKLMVKSKEGEEDGEDMEKVEEEEVEVEREGKKRRWRDSEIKSETMMKTKGKGKEKEKERHTTGKGKSKSKSTSRTHGDLEVDSVVSSSHSDQPVPESEHEKTGKRRLLAPGYVLIESVKEKEEEEERKQGTDHDIQPRLQPKPIVEITKPKRFVVKKKVVTATLISNTNTPFTAAAPTAPTAGPTALPTASTSRAPASINEDTDSDVIISEPTPRRLEPTVRRLKPVARKTMIALKRYNKTNRPTPLELFNASNASNASNTSNASSRVDVLKHQKEQQRFVLNLDSPLAQNGQNDSGNQRQEGDQNAASAPATSTSTLDTLNNLNTRASASEAVIPTTSTSKVPLPYDNDASPFPPLIQNSNPQRKPVLLSPGAIARLTEFDEFMLTFASGPYGTVYETYGSLRTGAGMSRTSHLPPTTTVVPHMTPQDDLQNAAAAEEEEVEENSLGLQSPELEPDSECVPVSVGVDVPLAIPVTLNALPTTRNKEEEEEVNGGGAGGVRLDERRSERRDERPYEGRKEGDNGNQSREDPPIVPATDSGNSQTQTQSQTQSVYHSESQAQAQSESESQIKSQFDPLSQAQRRSSLSNPPLPPSPPLPPPHPIQRIEAPEVEVEVEVEVPQTPDPVDIDDSIETWASPEVGKIRKSFEGFDEEEGGDMDIRDVDVDMDMKDVDLEQPQHTSETTPNKSPTHISLSQNSDTLADSIRQRGLEMAETRRREERGMGKRRRPDEIVRDGRGDEGLMEDKGVSRQENAILATKDLLYEELRSKYEQLEQQNQTLEHQNQALEQQNQTLEQQNQTLEQQNQILEQQNQTLEQQNQTLEQQNQILEQQNQILEQQNQTLEQQNQTLEQQNQTLESQNLLLTSQLTTSQTTITSLQSDVTFFRAQYTTASTYSSQTHLENTSLLHRIGILESQSTQGLSLIKTTYEERLKGSEESCKMFSTMVDFLIKKDKAMDGDGVRERAGREPEVRRRCRQLEEEVKRLKGELERLEGELELGELRVESLEREKEEWEMEEMERLREQPRNLENTHAVPSDVQHTQDSQHSQETQEGRPKVYRCEWRISNQNPCLFICDTQQELEDHMIHGGHIDLP
ncbi:hypothetical protein J3R30DRAFT_3506989 [Lentinula aciculospora]|uniref:Uncharacterized protein n=1 Tax=Lentinula aciculospora TaxID=153920 RepID=A0A9W9DKQ5_9AGAR|nr:hypothetical protein J3R30DRAFT_3506989 [Lentinula aciculospora]